MEKTNQERADELFEKEQTANAAYFTKDGNMFRAKRYADDWAKGSNGGEVETIYRNTPAPVEAPKDDAPKAKSTGSETKEVKVKAADSEEKEALTKRYIELYDTKPAHNTGIPKLKAAIAAKELDNEKAAENPQD